MYEKDERIILPLRLINKIKKTTAPSTLGLTFRFKELLEKLKKFLEREKELIGDLHKEFGGGKKLSDKNLQCALRRTAHHESGAASALRNLLCYYAYRKSWIQTLAYFGLTEDGVKKESQEIKGTLRKPPIEDDFYDAKSKMEEAIKQIERIVLQKRIYLLDKNTKELLTSIKENKFYEVEKYLQQNIKLFEAQKNEYLKNILELALMAFYQSKHEKAIEYSEIILKYEPELLLAIYIYTASLIFIKEFKNALIPLKKLDTLSKNTDNYIYLTLIHYLQSILYFNSTNCINNCPLIFNEININNDLIINIDTPYFMDPSEPVFDHFPELKEIKENLFLPNEFQTPVIAALNEKFIRNHLNFYVWFIQIYLTIFRNCMFDFALLGMERTLLIQPNNFLLLDFRSRFINSFKFKSGGADVKNSYQENWLGKGLTYDSAYENARYHAVCGRKNMAFELLEKAINLNPSLKERAREDYSFKCYRDDSLFIRYVS